MYPEIKVRRCLSVSRDHANCNVDKAVLYSEAISFLPRIIATRKIIPRKINSRTKLENGGPAILPPVINVGAL